LGDRGLLRARADVTARAAGVEKGRLFVSIEGSWRFAVAGRDRPATHVRARVARSLRCGSDRRSRVSTPAQAGLRMSAGQETEWPVTSAGVQNRRCAGVSCSTFWGFRRRCRLAPASSGIDYPGYTAKAGTQVCAFVGVRTLLPVATVSCAGLRFSARGYHVSSCSRTG